jgi:hypothetical protein
MTSRFWRNSRSSNICENTTVLSLSFPDSYHWPNREHPKISRSSVHSLANTQCSPAVKAICHKVFWFDFNSPFKYLLIASIKFYLLKCYSFCKVPTAIQDVTGGKVNILGGHSISHSKQNIYIYTCVLFRKVSEIQLFHCKVPQLLIRKRNYVLFLISLFIVQVTKLVQVT